MTNILAVMITSIFYLNPYIGYLFFFMVIIGVAVTYLYRKEVGFMTTIVVSALLGYSGMITPFVFILSGACLVLLILSIKGGGSILRPINNLQSWIYLKMIAHKK